MQDPIPVQDVLEQRAEDVNILEELLMALMGHPGDVFEDTSSPRSSKIADRGRYTLKTSTKYPFIPPPQRQSLLTS